jgi:hypothetical protein
MFAGLPDADNRRTAYAGPTPVSSEKPADFSLAADRGRRRPGRREASASILAAGRHEAGPPPGSGHTATTTGGAGLLAVRHREAARARPGSGPRGGAPGRFGYQSGETDSSGYMPLASRPPPDAGQRADRGVS